MNKYLRYFFALLLIGFSVCSYAEQAGYPKDPTTKNEKKNKKNKSKKDKKSKEMIEIDSTVLNQQETETDPSRIFDSNNVDNPLLIDSLENEINRLKEENTKLKEEIDGLTTENNRKDKRLKELEIFEAQYLATLATSFDSDWASKPYNEMNVDDLNELVEMCAKYSSQDKQIEEAKVKFSILQKELAAYNNGVQLNVGAYNLPKINQTLIILEEVRSDATPLHQEELKNIAKSLKNYRIDVSLLKEMIEEIDKTAAEFVNHAASINGVKEVLEKYDGDLGTITTHPWLAAKYKDYLEEINKNCKEQGPAREAIMSLKAN